MSIATEQTRSPRREKSADRLPWRRVLVPIDFSKSSLRALRVAVPLARDCGARLFLLAVVVPPVYVAGMDSVAVAIPDSALAEGYKDSLPKIARHFIPPSVKATTLVGRGRAVDVITRVAKEKEIDLIVLTTHGRTGIEHVLMGSTAERVVRHAPCPVYVVRSFAHQYRNQHKKD
jgi:universal stress protein A